MAKKKESLIVASKVKAYIKSKKMMTSSDSLEAISDLVYNMLDAQCFADRTARHKSPILATGRGIENYGNQHNETTR